MPALAAYGRRIASADPRTGYPYLCDAHKDGSGEDSAVFPDMPVPVPLPSSLTEGE